MLRRPRWRRWSLATAVIAPLAALGLASTASATVPALKPGQKVTITWESYNLASAGAPADTVKSLVAKFEKLHPNITVKLQAPQGTDYTASVQRELVAGDPPDVAQLVLGDLNYVVNGLHVPSLDSLFGKQAVNQWLLGGSDPYQSRAAQLANYQGQTYGLPYVFSTPTLFYNATLFKKAGLNPNDPPKTWAEVESDALAIKKATGDGGTYVDCTGAAYSDWCLTALAESAGGQLLSSNGKTLPWTSAGTLKAINMLHGLASSGAMPNEASADAEEAFFKGQLGMLLDTSALQGASIAGASSGGWQLDAASLPSFGSTPSVPTNSGSGLFILSKDPAKQAASWELIKFLTSPTAETAITENIGYLPLRTSLLNESQYLKGWAAKQGKGLIEPNIEQLSRLEPWVSFPGNNYEQIRTLLINAVQTAVFNSSNVAQTMSAAQQQAQKLMPNG